MKFKFRKFFFIKTGQNHVLPLLECMAICLWDGWALLWALDHWWWTQEHHRWMTLTTCRQDVLVLFLFGCSFIFSFKFVLTSDLWEPFSSITLAATIHPWKVPNEIDKSIWFSTTFEKQPELPGGPFLKRCNIKRVQPVLPYFFFLSILPGHIEIKVTVLTVLVKITKFYKILDILEDVTL